MDIEVTNKEEYESALNLIKEYRDKNYNLLLKTYTEPLTDIEKNKIKKEMAQNKKIIANILTQVVIYEKDNNIERRKNK